MVSHRRGFLSQVNWAFLIVLLLIPVSGLVVLYSAGFDADSSGASLGFLPITFKSVAFGKQLLFVVFGLIAVGFVALIPGEKWNRLAYALYAVFILALCAVLVPGVGVISHGARRWFSFGGFYFQPSETMKFVLILTLARYLSRMEVPEGGLGARNLVIPSLLMLIPMGLIIDQPDLGTALSLGILGALMILFVGVRPKVLLACGACLLVGIIPAWTFLLHPYQQRRVLSLLNPEESPLGSGYHIVQSKIAVGSGELFGKGFMSGTQTQLGFLPEHTTDFIFSVLSEEWGFLGSTFLISLYLLLIYLILRVALRSRDLFSSLVCVGVGAILFVHVFVNIGMVIGILPVVGITLPLFSYGGSSMISFMAAVGLVVGIQMRRFAGVRGLAVLFTLLIPLSSRAQEPSAHTAFEPLTIQTIEILLERVVADQEKLKPLPVGVPVTFDLKVRDFWSGATTKFENTLVPVLYLTNKSGKIIKLFLTFEEDDHIIVRSSQPRFNDYIGGIRAEFPKRGRQDLFIPGRGGQHILSILLDYGSVGNRALLICPSIEQEVVVESDDPDVEKKIGELVDGEFTLSEVGLSVRGSAEGMYIAGTKPGLARAAVFVSPGLPPSEPYKDSTSSKKPEVDIRYLPPKFEEVKIPFDSSKPFIEGITVELEFENSIGLKLNRRSSIVFEVQNVRLKNRIPLKLKNTVIETRAPGTCLIVRHQIRQDESRVDHRSKP